MTIDEAKERAKRAADAAWGVQTVRQADGTTLELCYHGRIHRAYKLLIAASNAGDGAMVARLQAGIDQLAATADAAGNAAEEAIAEYSAMAAAQGDTPNDLYPLQCPCVGCREAGAMHRLGSSMGNVRAATWRLMGDDGDGAPALVALSRKGDEDTLLKHIAAIVTAMTDYLEACASTGTRPNWKELWA